MKRIVLFVFLLVPAVSWAQSLCPRVIEDFQKDEADRFPQGFITYPRQHFLAPKVYRVKKDAGNGYLSATATNDLSVQIFRPFSWKSAQWPLFSWRWRARELPQGAAEDDDARNDSSCGIYVVFGRWRTKTMKYVWSTTLPVGRVIEKDPGKFYTFIMESGPKHVGTWQTVRVNVLEDYQRVFHSRPSKRPSGFGILTDGNAMHTRSSCDYDDFRVSPAPKKAPSIKAL